MKRNTVQYRKVLEAVRFLHSHATADEVYEEVVKHNPSIGRATVYRNLNKLCEEGLIRKRYIPGDAERFDHICTNHYHGKCMKCGSVFDVDMEFIPELQKYIKGSYDFEIKEHDIVFRGYCKNCRNS